MILSNKPLIQFISQDLSSLTKHLKASTSKNSDVKFFAKRKQRDSQNSIPISNGTIKEAMTDCNSPLAFSSNKPRRNNASNNQNFKNSNQDIDKNSTNQLPQIQNQNRYSSQRKSKLVFQDNKFDLKGHSNEMLGAQPKSRTSDYEEQVQIIKRKMLNQSKKSSFQTSKHQSPLTLEKVVIKLLGYDQQQWNLRCSDQSLDAGYSNMNILENNSKTSEHKSPIKIKCILTGHNIREEHRARMIDWLIQVFRVFKICAPQTFFLTINIMDRYFKQKSERNEILDKQELHEIGLVAILLATKFEDVIPIHMNQILRDAGHNKFKQSDILNREIDVLLTLGFKVQSITVFEEATTLAKMLFNSYKKGSLTKHDEELFFNYLLFACQLSQHSLKFTHHNVQLQATAIVMVSLKYLRKFLKAKIEARSQKVQRSPSDNKSQINLNLIKGISNYFKIQHILESENEQETKSLIQSIVNYLPTYQTLGLKNLEKSYPQYLDEVALRIMTTPSVQI
ncbi:UNKNOWN [Stylonychia lemnae]|uniref:Cyclin-like domain-containing protein n=1 Tax=Stylonychia lemnae TaxID=5949 RepID=A0A078B3W1_STYLE|nr:UNKNOWN [Stylonychia lemnae]|eukprot:CDW89235.1 UNKNOWN [Stylonychia lemnae]